MRNKYFGLGWLIPALGVALVLGGMMGAASYLSLERQAQSSEALAGTMDHLYLDQTLSLALRRIHDGDVATASRQLDLLLCDDILQLNSKLASADDRTRVLVGDGFRRIGRLRPETAPASAQAAAETTEDQVVAQRILGLAMADEPRGESKGPGM